MAIHKCKNCHKAFASECGLSSHFQHRQVCKSIHYEITNEDIEMYKEKRPDNSINNSAKSLSNSIMKKNKFTLIT